MVQSASKALISTLLYNIHATSHNEAAWHDTLYHLGALLNSQWTTVAWHHFLSGHGGILYQAPDDPDLREAYAQHATRNPWFLSSEEYITGKVLRGTDLLGTTALKHTDFYRKLLQPHKLMHRLCGVAARRGELVYYISVHRCENQADFTNEDKAEFSGILAHLCLAMENSWKQRETSDFGRALAEVIQQTTVATFLTDAHSHILFQNRAANLLLEQDSGLIAPQNYLSATSETDNIALHKTIRTIAARAHTSEPCSPRVLSVNSSRDTRPIVLSIYPAGRTFAAQHGDWCDVVAISARNQRCRHEYCSFAQQFNFTPAQKRLSSLLFTGHSLASAAQILHVSDNTVRSHLKQIFQKTDTHSQMELVHLHSRVCVDID